MNRFAVPYSRPPPTISATGAVKVNVAPKLYKTATVLPAATPPPLAIAAVLIIDAAVDPAAIPLAPNPRPLIPPTIRAPKAPTKPVAAPASAAAFDPLLFLESYYYYY